MSRKLLTRRHFRLRTQRSDDMTEFLERLRAEGEPTRTALGWGAAIHPHVHAVRHDDPGDNDRETLLLLNEAERHADALRRVLRELTGGAK
jgi:acetyl esterase/lipase